MKRLLQFGVLSGICVLLLTSCYNTRILVGNVNPNQELRKVNKCWNGHLLGGLIPLGSAKVHPQNMVNGYSDYMIKTNTNFLNMLVSGVTFGIYTPTQTTFYVPYDANYQAAAAPAQVYNQPAAVQQPVPANVNTQPMNVPTAVPASAPQSQYGQLNTKTKSEGPEKYSRYFNIAYSKQKFKFDDSDEWMKNDYGVALTRGRTYYVVEPLKDLLRVGIDWTMFDLNFSGYSYEYEDFHETEKEYIYQGEVGMQVGPSLSVTPVTDLMVNGYVRYAPSFSCYYEDDFHCNYGSFFVSGLSVSYRTIALGVEGRWGRTKLEFDDEKATLKTAAARFYVGFRF